MVCNLILTVVKILLSVILNTFAHLKNLHAKKHAMILFNTFRNKYEKVKAEILLCLKSKYLQCIVKAVP